jgi:hypothetical protein
LPAEAEAAPSKFVYELCDPTLPGGAKPATSLSGPFAIAVNGFNTCEQQGGSVGIQQVAYTNDSAAAAALSVDVPETPGGFVQSETISAGEAALTTANNQTYVYEPGWLVNNAGDSQRTFQIRTEPAPSTLSGGSGGDFTITWNCHGGCVPGPIVYARYIAATEVDPKPPTVAGGGPIFAGGILHGHQELRGRAGDEGGGLSKLEALVNGVPAGPPTTASCNLAKVKNPSYSGTVALSPTPCPTRLESGWTFDTAVYPFQNGANAVQVCAADFSTLSEANRSCSPPQTVMVDDSCAESPIPGGVAISARFARSHKGKVTVPYNAEAKVIGALADYSGAAVSGATVCVEAQTEGSHKAPQPISTTTTDAHGHFVYRVPPGPNRKVLFGYRQDAFQVARTIRYYAHVEPSLQASPRSLQNGGQVHFWGQLPGPHRRGRVVVLQANVLGSKRWITFRKATSVSKGIFHAAYRFSATTRTMTYRFRALVPEQAGYPWVQGHSKPVKVLVHK